MIHYKHFKPYDVKEYGKRKKYDNNVYTFDIETSSYIEYKGKIYDSKYYESLSEDERKEMIPRSCMYIWMFSINDVVYYGRTWDELKEFLKMIDDYNPLRKIIFIHNLAFEFQYLYSNFKMENVFARKSHKVIKAELSNYNFELRCSYMMSNTKLDNLSKVYNLPVKKLVGNLDYSKIRHSNTPLNAEELAYCENDCLVLYHYILFELSQYEYVSKIPVTSTGHVRKELKDLIEKDYKYKYYVRKSINTDPHVYNLLLMAFQGGYTHSNWIHTDEVIKNVDSWDETSAYPYVMVTHKFPATQFKKSWIKKYEDMSKSFAYLLWIKFTNVKSKYYNNFISSSKCMNLRGAKYDNGRLISADSFEMVITDVDFRIYMMSYDFEYEIKESYYSIYKYLPIQYINFILDKYVNKTQYKGVEGKEIEYNLEKQKFNSLYGMTVTNVIKDEVKFENNIWEEVEMTNEEIEEKLKSEYKKGFLSFSYGVWVTAYARYNLLINIMKLDDYMIYADTDSLKLSEGYDKNIILEYNKKVEERIKYVSDKLKIDINKYAPEDKKGHKHMLGLFELEKEDYQKNSYLEFITQGAKKYAVKEEVIDKETKETKETKEKIKITVAGVPKGGAKALKKLEDFKDGLIFKFEDTNKNLLYYCDNQDPVMVKDYLGNELLVKDKSGCCLLPNTYTLGKALDYAHLLSDDSTKRNYYKEN